MNHRNCICFNVAMLLVVLSFGQHTSSQNISINSHIDGTLVSSKKAKSLAILIGDSGPVDRNGNQGYNRSNHLKKLADSLIAYNIASFRYDKRVVKQLHQGSAATDILFDDYVEDAKDVIRYFNQQESFESLVIIGHGQGALVGILASDVSINSLILLCGSGKNIGDVLIEQVGLSVPELKADTERIITKLKQGKTSPNYPSELSSAFNLDTQPFLISWMAYEPAEEIEKLSLPILIVQGTKDLQIPKKEAQLLASSCRQCQVQNIENMNHVLVEIRGDAIENYKSYSDPSFRISPKLIQQLIAFIRSY